MMHRTVTSALVRRGVADVFAFAITPSWWLQVSPITLRLEGEGLQQPLRVGAVLRQHVHVHGWTGFLDWTVDAIESDERCLLRGMAHGDGLIGALAREDAVELELTVVPHEGGAMLTRTFSYHVGFAEILGEVLGFGKAVDHSEDATVQTMVSMLENPLLWGERPDSTAPSLQHEADPLGDAAVAALISDSGDCTALERFLGSLYRGVPSLEGQPLAVQRFFEETRELPTWASVPRLEAASEVFLDWGVLAVGAHICASLPETYVMPRVAKLLNLTRQLDADPVHADRRLWFTVRMCFDVLARNGLHDGAEGRLALQRLRLIHATIRSFTQHQLQSPSRLSRLSSNALWDSENGQPISQLDLLHTLLTFSHVVVRALDVLGAELTPYQRESYIHLWNVAGVQLGIRPELLPRDAADAAQMFEAIKARYGEATPEAKELGRALVWFWTSLFPKAIRNEATELMQFVAAQLLTPETAAINGFETLPTFSPTAAKVVKTFLDGAGRLCTVAFDEVPGARQAMALVVSLLMRAATHADQDESGIFDVPDEMYARWTACEATATNGGIA